MQKYELRPKPYMLHKYYVKKDYRDKLNVKI